MKGIFNFREIGKIFEKDKKYTLIIIAGAAIILLLALIPSGSGKNENVGVLSGEELSKYERTLESRLTEILSEIENIGEIKVMVSLDASARTEYGKNADMLLEMKMPEVRGVIVVCSGGDDIIVCEKVVRAVTGVFAISSTRVSVMK